MGIKGSISINKKDNKIIKTPSFSKNVVDKVELRLYAGNNVISF